MLYVTCFVILSCDLPPTEELPDNGPSGKSDNGFDEAMFRKEITDALRKIPPRKFFEADIPILDVWNNIGYKTAIYLEFFYNICPQAKRTLASSGMACDYASGTQFRKFKISKYDNRTVAYIEKFGKPDFYISALWEMLYNGNNLSIIKYEKIFGGGSWRYAKTFSRYTKNPDGTILIEADGRLGEKTSYSFETSGLTFSDCQNVPYGAIYIYGQNEATLYFYGYKIYECPTCASAKINDYAGKFSFCGQWYLYDIFKNLLNFLE